MKRAPKTYKSRHSLAREELEKENDTSRLKIIELNSVIKPVNAVILADESRPDKRKSISELFTASSKSKIEKNSFSVLDLYLKIDMEGIHQTSA